MNSFCRVCFFFSFLSRTFYDFWKSDSQKTILSLIQLSKEPIEIYQNKCRDSLFFCLLIMSEQTLFMIMRVRKKGFRERITQVVNIKNHLFQWNTFYWVCFFFLLLLNTNVTWCNLNFQHLLKDLTFFPAGLEKTAKFPRNEMAVLLRSWIA